MLRLYTCAFCYYTVEDDLADVLDEIEELNELWKKIAKCLGIKQGVIDHIKSEGLNNDDALEEVVREWLKKNYNIKRFGPPSWKILAKAVARPSGGNNKALAEKITERYLTGKLLDTYLAKFWHLYIVC